MIKGIIFDLDGTLLDTITDLNISVNDTLKAIGSNLSYNKEQTKMMVGNGIRNLVKRACNVEDEKVEEAYKIFLNLYSKQYYKNSFPYDGIKEVIEELVKENILIGVNSNKNDLFTKDLIKRNFNNINIDYVFGHLEEYGIKPDPRAALHIMDLMKLNKDEIIYVGDSFVDYQTAVNAGFKCINVSWGFRKKDDLIKEGAELVIDNPGELLTLIKSC